METEKQKTEHPKPIIHTHEDLVKERERLCALVLEDERLRKEWKLKQKLIKKK